MSGSAFHSPSVLHEFPSGREASGWWLCLPEDQIEVAVGTIQRNGTPHHRTSGTACGLDTVSIVSHVSKMAEVLGNDQRQSREWPQKLREL